VLGFWTWFRGLLIAGPKTLKPQPQPQPPLGFITISIPDEAARYGLHWRPDPLAAVAAAGDARDGSAMTTTGGRKLLGGPPKAVSSNCAAHVMWCLQGLRKLLRHPVAHLAAHLPPCALHPP